MKTLSKTLITLTYLMVLFTGCKKEDQIDESAPTFTATLNGRDFVSGVTQANLFFLSASHQRAFIMMADDEKSSIHILFFDTIMNQDVKNNLIVIPQVQYNSKTHNDNYNTITSHVEFTKFDSIARLIDGNFSLVASNIASNSTITISEGKFKNIPYKVGYQN